MKLFCVRHGDAEPLPDDNGERPLTQIGREEVSKVAAYLVRRGVNVIHVLHSGEKRAQETASILAQSIAQEQALEVCKFLSPEHYSLDPLVEKIQGWHDDTMLVGHMPFMSYLVSALVLGKGSESHHPDIVRFSPGTVVCLEYSDNRWMLSWVLRPELVPG